MKITPPGTYWGGATLSQNGRFVLAGQGNGLRPRLYVWSTTSQQMLATGLRGWPLDISDDGRLLVYRCGESVCFTTADKHTRRVPLAPLTKSYCPHVTPYAVMAPGDRFILVNCSGSGTSAAVLVSASGSAMHIFRGLNGEAVSADGRTAVLLGGPDPWVWHDGRLRQVVRGLGNGSYASRNAIFISYVRPGEGIELKNVLTGISRLLVKFYPGCCYGEVIADNGSRILYEDLSIVDNAPHVNLLDTKLGTKRDLAPEAAATGYGAFPVGISRDGNVVAYITEALKSPTSNPNGIYVYRVGEG
jgi:hypothetical protein